MEDHPKDNYKLIFSMLFYLYAIGVGSANVDFVDKVQGEIKSLKAEKRLESDFDAYRRQEKSLDSLITLKTNELNEFPAEILKSWVYFAK